MPKNQQLRSELRRWISEQKAFPSLRAMSTSVGIPFNTLRGYFSGKIPNRRNLEILTKITGLNLLAILGEKRSFERAPYLTDRKKLEYGLRMIDELQIDLARCQSGLLPVRNILAGQGKFGKNQAAIQARVVQEIMDSLECVLRQFLNSPGAIAVLRQYVSGSDAGYLSGLLGAMFDDRRLDTWLQMTTYKYGSK